MLHSILGPLYKASLLHYGLQRSGTNYLATILRKLYRIHFLNQNKRRDSPYHKHFRLYDQKEMVPEPQYRNEIRIDDFIDFENLLHAVPAYYVIISKDPYSWLLSYEKWAKSCQWPRVPHHYIQEYNLFYGKWLKFSTQTERIVFVRYFDLLNDLDTELLRLESTMNLKRKLWLPNRKKNIRHVSQSDRFTKARLKYYLTEEYMKSFTKQRITEINGLLDPLVVLSLGYTMK